MSDHKNIDNPYERDQLDIVDTNIAASSSEVSSIAGSVKTTKTHQRISSSSERQIKFERAQKCLENAALVSKRIKEHRKATAELLGRPFEEDDGGDTASEMASTMSERTGYSATTDTSTTLSVQDALNIPGISESLANTLKQKELLMERIKQYKEISKKPMMKSSIRESKVDPSAISKRSSENNDAVKRLIDTVKEKENSLSAMQVKVKAMETTILDLQEKLNEKDQIIEAKNKATTLMSDSLSKKDKDSLALLEDTRQQMTKMQENFIAMEMEWKEEKKRLEKDIELKDIKIANLEEANTILENARFEIGVAHSKLDEELKLKQKEILQLEEKIKELSHTNLYQEKNDYEEEKGSLEIANMGELTKKIELLEQLNCQIRQSNKELENKLATIHSENKSTSSPVKKGSPLPTRKGGRNTASKTKSPWSHLSSESSNQEIEKKPNKNEITKLEMVVQSLNKDILEKEYIISQKDALISDLQCINAKKEVEKPSSNLVDIGVCTDGVYELLSTQTETENTKAIEVTPVVQTVDIKELEEKLNAAQEQISLLTNDIEAANKNMIKVKSTNKLKLKQLQKTIDNFSKVSDANAEIVKLNEELHHLTQKVAELEEEKGNLQLHLVDYDSGRLTESDIYKKMVEMENLAETRLKAIRVLETQKFDLVQELHILQQKNMEMEDKLADMSQLQNEQVCSEIKSVQLEEQVDELTASTKELELVIENLKLDKEQLHGTIKVLQEEKEELIQKLENYIQDNMELTDKLEKLSAEKVSSAESIEIVESLTTQEKLELEEYNKGIIEDKIEEHADNISSHNNKNIESLMEQSAELNNKIELFTQERQEVMEKMSKIASENKLLHEKISDLNNHSRCLQNDINIFTKEKNELQSLNQELTRQIDELKRERIEIMKETVEINKPINEDVAENVMVESHDEKLSTDKGISRTKSVKQLTKEILKLKNTIKEREAEIADSQMKILSLEEQQEKQKELLQTNASYENKIRSLLDENNQLKEELSVIKKDKELEQQLLQCKQAYNLLQQEMHKIQQEHTVTVDNRDSKIKELENLLSEYEKQIFNYGNTLQQKDKEITEYINQITKLNDVSQKLKSTIELLEEEKAKDQHVELVKSLNKQIAIYQKKLTENEEKIRMLEDEKAQLLSLKTALESKNINLDTELKKMTESFAEKQNIIKELQTQQQKHTEELSSIKLQTKEKDEEIHEIKLQLRKESIENEKLRTLVTEKDKNIDELTEELKQTSDKIQILNTEKNSVHDQVLTMETKNKELLEKLKIFALNIKKKASMYTDLESQFNDIQKQLTAKNEHLEQLSLQVETLPDLHEKLQHAEEEINRLTSQKITLEQQHSQTILQLELENNSLQEKLVTSVDEVSKLTDSLNFIQEENINLKTQIDSLNNKLVEHEIEQRNSMNFTTKISSLEAELNQKQNYIVELLHNFEQKEQQKRQFQFGYDAKVQEPDLYIESLETEINKYKSRICRLEESISVMEDRRHSLERKADQLDSQLQEKQKAYSEYTNQEDELINRLAVLMDHDRVVEKQLYEIENDNKELQIKIQHLSEDNQRLRKSLSDIQEHCNTLVDKASRADAAESEIPKLQSHIHELESNLKRITHEHQLFLVQKKQEIEELEQEFNTQIENAIKEKKILSEKYEKLKDRVSQLELKLQEYKISIENLNVNNEELSRINQNLVDKYCKQEQKPIHDYTEQYINEINRLNSVINIKSQEIMDLNGKIDSIKEQQLVAMSTLENKISQLTSEQHDSSEQFMRLDKETSIMRENNEHLQVLLSQKDEQIKVLKEKRNTLSFEMNIPKTDGMVITSTIEPVNVDTKGVDMSVLESQIVSDLVSVHPENKEAPEKKSESIQKQTIGDVTSDRMPVEEQIVKSKKAYLCYNTEDRIQETDPFNSDEGWGLGECEEISDVTPFSHLNEQIEQLTKSNEKLKTELEASNNKLLKALKKLKELKSNNEMLSNELKITKQISQSSFLDNAIEDELRMSNQELEKKINELSVERRKEQREIESLKKQNEVLSNGNDALTDIKEKLENEVELWKFKFKEANDKASTLEWGADSKEDSRNEPKVSVSCDSDNQFKEEILKIEKENDELQMMIDQLTSQNKELTYKNGQLKNELSELNDQLKLKQSSSESSESLQRKIVELQNVNTELLTNNEILNEKLRDVEIRFKELSESSEHYRVLSQDVQTKLETENKELIKKKSILEEEMRSLIHLDSEAKQNISSLTSELDLVKSKLHAYEKQQNVSKYQDEGFFALKEQYTTMEQHCLQLKSDLDEANNKILQLQVENQELLLKSEEYRTQINEFDEKMRNLNIENDNLLSSVAELRSSLSSAVDQRGFEIAELWKQHLSQREADFQKIESELKDQLSASELKYEQLLDSVQSSSQEETNKLVMIEQFNSLQNKLQDKEEHLRNLQDKYAEVMNQLDMLRSEMDDEKIVHDNKLLEQQEEYEKIVRELTVKTKENSNTYDETLKNIQMELMATKANNDELKQTTVDLHKVIKESEARLLELSNELQVKDREIYQKVNEYTITLSQRNEEFENVRKQLMDYEKKVEDLNYEKESELAVLRLKMHENGSHHEKVQRQKDSEILKLTDELNVKITECSMLNKQIINLNQTLEEQSKTVAEMQTALENQEIEIVTLKDELSHLQSIMKSSTSKIEKHVSFASDTKPASDEAENILNKDLLDAVPRAELDLALYMLHQRDVRCEELTMELTRLLEERDTLQLRLSDSLRSNEDLKSKLTSAGLDESISSSQEAISELPSFTVEREQQFVDIHRGQTSRSSSIGDPDGDKPKLQAKLSELRSVRHSRDVLLRHESEQRQLDLRLLQRDVANLPPEAIDQLTQAHHTLSRDSQSTSTVLLNWLRGKSTPKVVHM